MTAKAGIKKHRQVTVDALFQEFLQLHDLDVLTDSRGTYERPKDSGITSHQYNKRKEVRKDQRTDCGRWKATKGAIHQGQDLITNCTL
jgi:hypothetical protein